MTKGKLVHLSAFGKKDCEVFSLCYFFASFTTDIDPVQSRNNPEVTTR